LRGNERELRGNERALLLVRKMRNNFNHVWELGVARSRDHC